MRWERVSTASALSQPYHQNSRHQSRGNSLESHGQESQEAGKVRAQTRKVRGNAREESQDREEEGDDVEGPRDSAQVIVGVSTNNIVDIEVAAWVEGNRSACVSAVCVDGAVTAADGEVSPARWVGDIAAVEAAAEVVGCGLQEVDSVDWSRIGAAGS